MNACTLSVSVINSHLFPNFPSFKGYSIFLNLLTSTNCCPKSFSLISCIQCPINENFSQLVHCPEIHEIKKNVSPFDLSQNKLATNSLIVSGGILMSQF